MLSMAMAFSSSSLLKQQFIVSILFVIITTINSQANGCFTSIFSFGDSLSDTGNLLHIALAESRQLPAAAFPPNGRTFFHHPTGRQCDGRLIIDFLVEGLGFPLLTPYFGAKNGRSKNFEKGVNFAVSGARALNYSFLEEKGIHGDVTNLSLADELNLFKDLLPSLCSSSSDCKELLRNSLIVMGEIGGNDYNHPLIDGKLKIEEIRQFVPLVVDNIASAINELIELGAVTFLVPGNLPIGCYPTYLTQFLGLDKQKYDPLTGCITWLNQFSQHHNELLHSKLKKIRNLHPNINIVYADYYNAAMRIYRSPKQFGFRETLKACCGTGGIYNYNASTRCGYPPVRSCCNDPSSFLNWDGIHYTEAANRWIAKAVLEQLINTLPSLNNLCPPLTVNNKSSIS